jgi:hypothetical protein
MASRIVKILVIDEALQSVPFSESFDPAFRVLERSAW